MKNNPLSVALIEDDEDDQFLFSIVLNRISVATKLTILESKKDIEDNIQYLESLSPDIIFLGCPLIPNTEIDYLKKIRKSTLLKETFCVIISGYCHEQYLKETFNAGANLYMNKPNDISTLTNLIKGVLTMDKKDYHPPKFESFQLA